MGKPFKSNKMINFVNAESVKTKLGKIDTNKVEIFIKKFNSVIVKGIDKNSDGSFTLNDGIDKIPTLNNLEFDYARKLAAEQGWVLTTFKDNYQTTSYKIKIS